MSVTNSALGIPFGNTIWYSRAMNTIRTGRPKLGSDDPKGRSPLVVARLPHQVHDAFLTLVETSGRTSSELLREAVLLLLDKEQGK